jgi:hypothetical protein
MESPDLRKLASEQSPEEFQRPALPPATLLACSRPRKSTSLGSGLLVCSGKRELLQTSVGAFGCTTLSPSYYYYYIQRQGDSRDGKEAMALGFDWHLPASLPCLCFCCLCSCCLVLLHVCLHLHFSLLCFFFVGCHGLSLVAAKLPICRSATLSPSEVSSFRAEWIKRQNPRVSGAQGTRQNRTVANRRYRWFRFRCVRWPTADR